MCKTCGRCWLAEHQARCLVRSAIGVESSAACFGVAEAWSPALASRAGFGGRSFAARSPRRRPPSHRSSCGWSLRRGRNEQHCGFCSGLCPSVTGDEEALCQGTVGALPALVPWPSRSLKVLEWARGKQPKLLDQQRLYGPLLPCFTSCSSCRCVSAGLEKRKTARPSIQHLMP